MKDLLRVARRSIIEDWATHIAVSKDGEHSGSVRWDVDRQDYVAGPTKYDVSWAGVHTYLHWEYFAVERVLDVEELRDGIWVITDNSLNATVALVSDPYLWEKTENGWIRRSNALVEAGSTKHMIAAGDSELYIKTRTRITCSNVIPEGKK